MKAAKTLDAINAGLERAQERDHRAHLGASVLGGKCMRKVWYGWRWAARETFSGRMLRLFERGQLEEDRFSGYLRGIGCDVWPLDPTTGNQWRISFAWGHGGGSADGIARGIPDLPPGTPFLTEFKTHNEKSFLTLQADGLCQSKPEHFAQTQIYTVKLGLSHALYMAVNKNTDELHAELIEANPGFVATLMSRAEMIVASETPPARVSKSPTFYLCKSFNCKFYALCFQGGTPEVNCRTCEFSKPIQGSAWLCQRYGCPLTREQQALGCKTYKLKSNFNA